jgi:hypothetical protein
VSNDSVVVRNLGGSGSFCASGGWNYREDSGLGLPIYPLVIPALPVIGAYCASLGALGGTRQQFSLICLFSFGLDQPRSLGPTLRPLSQVPHSALESGSGLRHSPLHSAPSAPVGSRACDSVTLTQGTHVQNPVRNLSAVIIHRPHRYAVPLTV